MAETEKCWSSRHNLSRLVERAPGVKLELFEFDRGTLILNKSYPINPQSPTLLIDLDDVVSAYHYARQQRDEMLNKLFGEAGADKLKECDSYSRLSYLGENVYFALMHILLLSSILQDAQVNLKNKAEEFSEKDIINNPGQFAPFIDPRIAEIFRQTTYQPPIYKDIVGLIKYLEKQKDKGEKTPNVMIFTYGEEEFQAFKCLSLAYLNGRFSPAIQGFLFPRQDKGNFIISVINNQTLPNTRYILIDDSKRHIKNFMDKSLEACWVIRPGTKSYKQDYLNPEALIFPEEFYNGNFKGVASRQLPKPWRELF